MYRMPYHRAADHDALAGAITRTLAEPGAAMCEVMLDLRAGLRAEARVA
ncbi:MAG: hypothetical protein R3A52_12730 [Polyangiales bacterium]